MTASVPFFILDSPLGQVLRPEFQAGLTFGLVGLGLVLLAGALLRLSSRSTGPIRIAGLVVVGAGVAALSQTERLPDGLAPGLGALLLGGLVADIFLAPWRATLIRCPTPSRPSSCSAWRCPSPSPPGRGRWCLSG